MHKELVREVVRKSLVLLKNGESADEPLIPLPKKASKVLVAEPMLTILATNVVVGLFNGRDKVATLQLEMSIRVGP